MIFEYLLFIQCINSFKKIFESSESRTVKVPRDELRRIDVTCATSLTIENRLQLCGYPSNYEQISEFFFLFLNSEFCLDSYEECIRLISLSLC